jgi:hypothetical protein
VVAVLVTGGIAYLRGDAKHPARAMVQLGAGSRGKWRQRRSGGFPTDDLVVPERVIYSATDGMPVHAQLFLPPGGTLR